MLKKMMIIVNPVAGRGGYAVNFGEALRLFSQKGYIPTLYFTTAKGDATLFAERGISLHSILRQPKGMPPCLRKHTGRNMMLLPALEETELSVKSFPA